MNKIILYFVLLLACFSCSQEKLYNYQNDFELYLKEIHHLKESDFEETIFYVLDVESCSCSELNFKSLSMLLTSKNVVLVIIGTSKIWEHYKPKLNYFTILEDVKSEIRRYETGLGKPLLLHYKNQEIIYYQNVTDQEIAKASAYILNPN